MGNCQRKHPVVWICACITLFPVVLCIDYHHGDSSYVDSIPSAQAAKFLPRLLPSKMERRDTDTNKELECEVRKLAYSYAQQIQSFRGDQQDTFDALNINGLCGSTVKRNNNNIHYRSNTEIMNADSPYTVYIDPIHGNDQNTGNILSPLFTMHAALTYLRSFKSNQAKQIIIRQGTVYLNSTITLSPDTFDNNLLIRSYPNENVTVSGGILIPIDALKWQRYYAPNASYNIWKATLDSTIVDKLFNNTILSLFTETPHTRLTRARYPNGHVEVWNNGRYYLNPNLVNKWWLPPNGTQYKPEQIFKDLSNCNTTSPCLNHSQYAPFDTYTAGHGHLCDLWTPSYSYWCGKNCAGGWGNEDQRMATEGIRQLPIGMTFNTTLLPEIAQWGHGIDTAVFHIAHSQGWNMFMWQTGDVDAIDTKNGNVSFGNGGYQGGRVWTKTTDLNRHNPVTNIPIAGGKWYIENVLSVLDAPNEWYYDKENRTLYYWPNNTITGQSPVDTKINLVIGNVAHLFELKGARADYPLRNITFMDLEFRDTRYTYLDAKWGAPSGGDWALYNGGAFHLENTSNCSIRSSTFTRLDGNCVTLYGYNRNTTIARNVFEYIGDNVVGLWGVTNDYDGTNGLQPRYTYVTENYVHDIGLYQLQSSLLFQAKSCLNSITNNIVFNVPRAAILFNDAFGGSNEVIGNLLFNTCTQSGDHGPINSWNRMPFLTNVAHGYPSFDAGYTNVSLNFIFANYGGSQGFDTDDGSAYYNMFNNFFYDAMGYKNDYGGYNVNYYANINVALSGNAYNCWEIEPVHTSGPGNDMHDNKCIVFACPNKNNPTCDVVMGLWPSNLHGALKQYNNSFYTPHGNATIQTSNTSGQIYLSPQEMYQRYGLSENSTQNMVPSVEQIVLWVKDLLNI